MSVRAAITTILLAAATIATAEARAGDFAALQPIGFSSDGNVFAFEEYGVQDGSGFPYSTVYVLDTRNDSFLPGAPVRAVVEDDKGELVMLAGAGGGPRIITAVWQTISNVIDFGKGAAQAVDEPRVHHQHLPDTLYVESLSIDGPTETDLRGRGYKLDWGSDFFGSVTAIVRTKGGGWEGAADPRGGGKAQGD